MKRLIILLLLFFMVVPSYSNAENQGINVVINGQSIQSDVNPRIINNITFVPIRPFFEALGFDVNWLQDAKKAIVGYGNPKTLFKFGFGLGDNKIDIVLTGKDEMKFLNIDNSATLIDNNIYVPLRSFADLIGAEVNWDDNSRTVTLNATKEQIIAKGIVDYFKDAISYGSQINPQQQFNNSSNVPLLFSGDGQIYLGKLTTNTVDPESIFNNVGIYGSNVSPTSIFNNVGIYGSNVSPESAFNDVSFDPPIIILNDKIIGRLTTNNVIPGGVSLQSLVKWLKDNGY